MEPRHFLGHPLFLEIKAAVRGVAGKIHGGWSKAGGSIVDSRGRKWTSALHPRDSRGRFIETGGIARVHGYGQGKVTRITGRDSVEVQLPDGRKASVKTNLVTMIRRPDGTSPTQSRTRVMDEDEKREQDPQRPNRGDGKADLNPDLDGIPDDEEPEDVDDQDDDDPGDDAPAMQVAKVGDLAILSNGNRRKIVDVIAVDEDGRATKYRDVGGTQTHALPREARIGLISQDAVNRAALRNALMDYRGTDGQPRTSFDSPEETRDFVLQHRKQQMPAAPQATVAPDAVPAAAQGAQSRRKKVALMSPEELADEVRAVQGAMAVLPDGDRENKAPLVRRLKALKGEMQNRGLDAPRMDERDREQQPVAAAQQPVAAPQAPPVPVTPDVVPEAPLDAPEQSVDREQAYQNATADLRPMTVNGPGYARAVADELRTADRLHRDGNRDEERDRRVDAARQNAEENTARVSQARARQDEDARAVDGMRGDDRPEVQSLVGEYDSARERGDLNMAGMRAQALRALPAGEQEDRGLDESDGPSDEDLAELEQEPAPPAAPQAAPVARTPEQLAEDTASDREAADDVYARMEAFRVRTAEAEAEAAEARAREAEARADDAERDSSEKITPPTSTEDPDGPRADDRPAAAGAVREPGGAALADVSPERDGAAAGQREGAVLPVEGSRGARDGGVPGGTERGGEPADGAGGAEGAAASDDDGAAQGGGGSAPRVGVRGGEGAGDRGEGAAAVAGAGPAAAGVAPPRFRPSGQEDLAPEKPKDKARANLDAIELRNKLKAEGRPATAAEQRVLARWAGWGAVPQMFMPAGSAGKFEAEAAELKELLTAEEWERAFNNTANAHYTDAKIVDEMWTALRALGFDGGEVLEAGSGSGNFIGRAPADAKMTGVELEPVTADISALLYPDAKIIAKDFGEVTISPGTYDAAIGNVPFGQIHVYDPAFNKNRKEMIHNHFIQKELAALKPGGVAAFITSSGTLDAPSSDESRAKMHEQADLLGAVRLPTGTHAAAANTEVVTDVLIFRKPLEGEDRPTPGWLTSSPGTAPDGSPLMSVGRGADAKPQFVSDYMQGNPDNVLGEFVTGGWNGAALRGNVDEVPERLRDRLAAIVAENLSAGRGASKTRVKPRAVTKRKPTAPKAATPAAGLFEEPSERTLARRDREPKVVGQISHVGSERVPGKAAGSKGSVKHHFTIVDLEGDEVAYDPSGAASAGTTTKRDAKGRLAEPNQADEMVRLKHLRDVLGDLSDAERESLDTDGDTDEDSDELKALRKQLNDVYDAYVKDYGPIGRRTVTMREVPEPELDENGDLPPEAADLLEVDGKWFAPSIRNPQMGGIRQDPTWWAIVGLEKDYNDDTDSATKADIFTERQLGRRAMRTTADSPADALVLSREVDGKIDLARIASLLGIPPEQAFETLGDLVYRDHRTGDIVPANTYLAGDVRVKVKELRKAVETDPSLQRNLDAMIVNVPADKDPTKITSRLGAPWIDPDDFQQFLRELSGDPKTTIGKVFDADTGKPSWQVLVGKINPRDKKAISTVVGGSNMDDFRDFSERVDEKGKVKPLLARWGTGRRSAYDLVETLLKGGRPQVKDKIRNDEGKETEVLNEEETNAAILKAEQIAKEFNSWLWRDDARAKRLHESFNDRFRGYTDVNYVDSHRRTYGGMTDAINLDGHQNDAVNMAMDRPAVMLDHEVGTGKSYTMAAIVMERRRLGLNKKVVQVVPNHLLEQTVREFKHLYPDAKVLATDSDGISGDKRKRFVAQAAASDWDVVIMTKTSFASIPLSETKQMDNLIAEVSEMRARRDRALADANGKDTAQVKKWATKLLDAENKLKALKDRLDRDKGGLDFEGIGFDGIVIDEFHEYKNDLVESSSEALAKAKPNLQAVDMREKMDYLREQDAKLNRLGMIVAATGTPVSNSTREFYVHIRFMRPDLLKQAGIETFDDFSAQFLEMRESIEQSVSGKLQVKMREGDELVNTGELKRMWVQFADTVTAEDVGIDRPGLIGGSAEKVIGQVSPNQNQYLSSLEGRKQAVPKTRKPKKGDDTVVAVGTDGLIASVDLRLLSDRKLAMAGLRREDLTVYDSKIPLVGDAILAELERTKDFEFNVTAAKKSPKSAVKGAGQLVFLDKGIPKGDAYSTYQGIKDWLVAGGMKPEEVAFIHDAKDAGALGKLTEKFRQGEIKVLLVSTPKGGTGLNVQNRLSKLHHVDGAYRPDQIEQRNGRIVRRGNQMKQYGGVGVAYYPLEGSTEGFQWAHVSRKDNFLRQFAQADLDATIVGRSDAETGSESDFLAALSAKNPLLMDRVVVDKTFKTIQSDRDAATSAQEYHSNVVRKGSEMIRRVEQSIADLDAAEAARVDTTGEKFSMDTTDQYGRATGTVTDRKEAAKRIGAIIKEIAAYAPQGDGSRVSIGKLGGLQVYARTYKQLGAAGVRLQVLKPGGASYRDGDFLDLQSPVFNPFAEFDSTQVVRIEGLLRSFGDRKESFLKDIAAKRQQMAVSAVEADREFDRPEEYAALKARKAALDELLRQRTSAQDAARAAVLAGNASSADEVMAADPKVVMAQIAYDGATVEYERIRDARVNEGSAYQAVDIGAARTSRRKVKQQDAALARARAEKQQASARDFDREIASSTLSKTERTAVEPEDMPDREAAGLAPVAADALPKVVDDHDFGTITVPVAEESVDEPDVAAEPDVAPEVQETPEVPDTESLTPAVADSELTADLPDADTAPDEVVEVAAEDVDAPAPSGAPEAPADVPAAPAATTPTRLPRPGVQAGPGVTTFDVTPPRPAATPPAAAPEPDPEPTVVKVEPGDDAAADAVLEQITPEKIRTESGAPATTDAGVPDDDVPTDAAPDAVPLLGSLNRATAKGHGLKDGDRAYVADRAGTVRPGTVRRNTSSGGGYEFVPDDDQVEPFWLGGAASKFRARRIDGGQPQAVSDDDDADLDKIGDALAAEDDGMAAAAAPEASGDDRGDRDSDRDPNRDGDRDGAGAGAGGGSGIDGPDGTPDADLPDPDDDDDDLPEGATEQDRRDRDRRRRDRDRGGNDSGGPGGPSGPAGTPDVPGNRDDDDRDDDLEPDDADQAPAGSDEPQQDLTPDITAGNGDVGRGVGYEVNGDGDLVLTGRTFPVKDQISATRLFRFDWPTKKYIARDSTLEGQQQALNALREQLGVEAPERKAARTPTPQQQEIIDAILRGDNVAVEALAGTGKTSTLEATARAVAKAVPGKHIFYGAFNKTTQIEAEGRMPGNVEARTGDSVGYTAAPAGLQAKFQGMRPTKDKPPTIRAIRDADAMAAHIGITGPLDIGDETPMTPARQAQLALRIVGNFAISADDEIGEQHLDGAPAALLPAARRAWKDIVSDDGRLLIANDHLTKLWALSRPDLSKGGGSGLRKGADIVFFDEAQDMNPVVAKVLADNRGKVQLVYVGDGNQAIYGFRGATDELSKVEVDSRLPMTQTFRFGQPIAGYGNRFLAMHDSPHRLEGRGEGGEVLPAGSMTDPDAILVRSNGGMVGEAIREQEAGRVVGVPKGTKADLRKLVVTSRYLQAVTAADEEVERQKAAGVEEPVRPKVVAPTEVHDDLAPFKNWGEVVEAAEEGDDAKVRMLAGIVQRVGVEGLDAMVRELKELGDDKDARTPNVVITTAHKAKGLEWKRVKIGDDFRGAKTNAETGAVTFPEPEELRLAYVAVTRAMEALDPGSLSWVTAYTDENGNRTDTGTERVTPEQLAQVLENAGVPEEIAQAAVDAVDPVDARPDAPEDAPDDAPDMPRDDVPDARLPGEEESASTPLDDPAAAPAPEVAPDPSYPEPTPVDPETTSTPEVVDVPEDPEDIAGQGAQWVPVTALMVGDTARVLGIDQRQRAVERAGYVQSIEPVTVARRRKKNAPMIAVTLSDNPDGSGDRGTVLASPNGIAAQAINGTIADPEGGGAPPSMGEVQVLEGTLPAQMPKDSQGNTIWPGSELEHQGQPATATAVTPTTVEVNRPNDSGDEPVVRPGTVTVTDDGAGRPEGWTEDGTPLRPGTLVDNGDGGPAVVTEVDGDDVQVTTPAGEVVETTAPEVVVAPQAPTPASVDLPEDVIPDAPTEDAPELELAPDAPTAVADPEPTAPEVSDTGAPGLADAPVDTPTTPEGRRRAIDKARREVEDDQSTLDGLDRDADPERYDRLERSVRERKVRIAEMEAEDVAETPAAPEAETPALNALAERVRRDEELREARRQKIAADREAAQEAARRRTEDERQRQLDLDAEIDAAAVDVPLDPDEDTDGPAVDVTPEEARKIVDRAAEDVVDGVQAAVFGEVMDALQPAQPGGRGTGGRGRTPGIVPSPGQILTPEKLEQVLTKVEREQIAQVAVTAQKIVRRTSGGRPVKPGTLALVAQMLARLIRAVIALVRLAFRAYKAGSPRPQMLAAAADVRQKMPDSKEMRQLRRAAVKAGVDLPDLPAQRGPRE